LPIDRCAMSGYLTTRIRITAAASAIIADHGRRGLSQ
jgi:hypothetical protein